MLGLGETLARRRGLLRAMKSLRGLRVGLQRHAVQRDTRVAAAHAGSPAVGDEQCEVPRAGARARAGPPEGMPDLMSRRPL